MGSSGQIGKAVQGTETKERMRFLPEGADKVGIFPEDSLKSWPSGRHKRVAAELWHQMMKEKKTPKYYFFEEKKQHKHAGEQHLDNG